MATRRSTPRPQALDRTLTYRLHQLKKLTDLVSQDGFAEAAGLSMSDGRALTTIGSFEPLSVKDLALRSNLDKSQASRAAQALIDQGLARKDDHPDDGRGVVLSLTPEGRRRCDAALAMVARRNEEIAACLSAPERRLFSELLDRLIDHNRRG